MNLKDINIRELRRLIKEDEEQQRWDEEGELERKRDLEYEKRRADREKQIDELNLSSDWIRGVRSPEVGLYEVMHIDGTTRELYRYEHGYGKGKGIENIVAHRRIGD